MLLSNKLINDVELVIIFARMIQRRNRNYVVEHTFLGLMEATRALMKSDDNRLRGGKSDADRDDGESDTMSFR
jgi:hypothetical protein